MRIIVATSNDHKLREMQEILASLNLEVVGLKELDFRDEIIEDGQTFIENAIIKARTISLISDDLVLSDDSGIEIDAFNKEPGIYSARYLGHETPYEKKNAIILERLKDETNRKARFVCALALCLKGEVIFEVSETIEGEIATEILGINGFGYDPIFYYPPLKKSTSQMSMAEKNEVSHRGKAMRKLLTYLKAHYA